MRKGIFLLLLGLAAVAVGFGCGGGSSDDEPALTKAQYLRQANAVCAQGDEAKTAALSAAAQKSSDEGRPLDEQGLEDLATDVALPAVRKMVGELSELVPPEKDEEKVEAIIDALETGLDKIEDKPKKFVSGGAFVEADKLANAYGLTACVL